MMMIRRLAWVWVFCLTSFVCAAKPELPSKTIPDGLGYNIHFTDPKPGEMEMMKASGATIIRMDFGWNGTEREKGVYDFSAFERLTDALEKHKIRPLYILDYSNRHYDEGLSPYSEEGRKAFAKWAAAAAVHFEGRGILWEMYNEPNIHFWKPKPDPEKYILLALEVGKALREAAPDETYIGPATSEIDFEFLEKCFQAGLLEYWDAVSVHPYRQREPESVIPEYARLRYMIDKYAPEGKKIPILSAEWGYSSTWANYNDELQGKMLPRQWMVNLACDVPVSIWYDWHDDGTDPKEPEHHFGTVNYEYKKDQTPVYDPKPSYLAAKTFTETFDGFKYNKRIWTEDENDFVFLFSKEGQKSEQRLAIWTLDKKGKTITVPCKTGKFRVVSYLGEQRESVQAVENALIFPEEQRKAAEVHGVEFFNEGFTISVSDGPLYLIPEESKELNGFLQKIAEIPAFPLALYCSTKTFTKQMEQLGVRLLFVPVPRNPVPRTFVGDSAVPMEGKCSFALRQPIQLISAEPISVYWELLSDRVLFRLSNPSGAPFSETLTFETDINNVLERIKLAQTTNEAVPIEEVDEIPIELKEGETSFNELTFPIQADEHGFYRFYYSVSELQSGMVCLKPFDDFTKYTPDTFEKSWRVIPDGDSKIASEQKLELGENGTAKLTYKFDAGWKFLNISPNTDELRKIEGKPKSLSVRIASDGSGNSVRMRFTDSQGQTFQPDGGKLTEKGPMFFTFDLQKIGTAHWGGPNDGVIHYPIRFDSIVIDGLNLPSGPNTLEISSPVLGYDGEEELILDQPESAHPSQSLPVPPSLLPPQPEGEN